MNSLVATSLGQQLSDHFFLQDKASAPVVSQSGYDSPTRDRLTTSLSSEPPNRNEVSHMNGTPSKPLNSDVQPHASLNFEQVQLPGVFTTAPVLHSEPKPTTPSCSSSAAAPSKSVSNANPTEAIRDRLTTMNRVNKKMLNRCKRGLVRFWRVQNTRAVAGKRLRAQLESSGPLSSMPTATCHCPSDSVLCDLQNKFSILNTELHSIQSRLTELQRTCASIQSTLSSLHRPAAPSCVSSSSHACTTPSVSPLSLCALTTTETKTGNCETVATMVASSATTDSASVFPQSASQLSSIPVFKSKLTPMSVHTGPFDAVESQSLLGPHSEPVLTTTRNSASVQDIRAASVPDCATSPLSSDCASSVFHSLNSDVLLEELLSDPSLKVSVYGSHTTTAVDTPIRDHPLTSSPSASPSVPVTAAVTACHTITTTNQLQNDAVCEPEDEAIDTFELVRDFKQLLDFHGVSQRQLARLLPDCSQRFLCELLSKPKPWLALTDRRRKAYRHLKNWFENPENLAKLSCINKRCLSPLVVNATAKPEVSRTICPLTSTQAVSTLGSICGTASTASSCSYSPGPSEPLVDTAPQSKRRRKSTSSMTSLSNYSNADSGSLFGGSTSSGLMMDDLRKQSSDGDIQTEKRIADILSAARIAMAHEQCEKARQAEVIQLTLTKTGDEAQVAEVPQASAGHELIEASITVSNSLSPPVTDTLSRCTKTEVHSTDANNPIITGSTTPSTSLPESAAPCSQSELISTVPTSMPLTCNIMASGAQPTASTSSSVPIMVAPLGVPMPTLGGGIPDLFKFLLTQSCNGMNAIQLTGPSLQPVTTLVTPVAPSSIVRTSLSCSTVQPTVIVPSSSSLPEPRAPGSVNATVTPTPLGMAPLIVSPLSMNPLDPLGQTMFLLAPSPSAAPNPLFVSSSAGSATGVRAEMNTADHTSGVNPKSRTASQNSGVSIAGHAGQSILPPREPDKVSVKPNDLPIVNSQTDTSPVSSSDVSELCTSDSTGRNASLTYKRPSTDEVIRIAKTLSDLDTDMLRVRVKDVLRQNGVSQRVFGEVILGMCQASVSDMLTKPRSWSQLTEKARLPYVRMHIWLNQLDQTDSSRGTPTNTETIVRSCDNETVSQDKPDSVTFESCKRERPHDTAGTSPLGTPVKLIKLEPTCASVPDEALTEAASGEILTASDRKSLVDIAKAAAMAMQRASSLGPNHCSKARKPGSQTCGSVTPTKLNVPPQPQPLTTMQLNWSDSEREPSLANSSPSKQSPGRNRVVFSPEQKQAMAAEFARQPYPSSESLRALAQQLNLPFKPVVNWFHNRRMRSRQRVPSTALVHDEATENVIDDLTTSILCPELPGRECNEDFSTMPNAGANALQTSTTQSNRRKRPDPTRLIAPSVANAPTSDESDLTEPVPNDCPGAPV